jgi:4-amino-4-deoxy-L-arabinose transferase-like glycosyltransferase
VPGAIVPICPSGLSIAMAPFVLAGGPRAAFFVLPVFAAVLVAATSAIGSRFGAGVGFWSSLLVAASPIVLYQVIQPMSDVPAAALWMLAVACATGTSRRASLLSGIATSAAILVRPNLVPLGFVIGLFLLLRPERTWLQRLRSAAIYAAACAPGCVIVALTQDAFYGSPLASGYGSLAELFSFSYVAYRPLSRMALVHTHGRDGARRACAVAAAWRAHAARAQPVPRESRALRAIRRL